MNRSQAADLFKEINKQCSLNKSEKGAHIGFEILGSKNQCILLIKADNVKHSSIQCIEDVVRKYGLKMVKSLEDIRIMGIDNINHQNEKEAKIEKLEKEIKDLKEN